MKVKSLSKFLNMKLDNFYHSEYLEYCLHLHCNVHYVSADASFGLLQVFHVELGSPHRTSSRTFYLIQGIEYSNSVNHDRVQAFSHGKYSFLFTCCWDWTCDLQMISLWSAFRLLCGVCCLLELFTSKRVNWVYSLARKICYITSSLYCWRLKNNEDAVRFSRRFNGSQNKGTFMLQVS